MNIPMIALAAAFAAVLAAAAPAENAGAGDAAAFYISGDIEGMSGFRSGFEKERNDRILHDHFLAVAEGLHDGGATQVLLKSFHGIPGEYPAFVKQIQKAVPGEFDLPGIAEAKGGLALVGFHGLPPECGFGHSYRFTNMWLNGKKIGEITIQMLRAAAAGVPTVLYVGDSLGAAEVLDLSPDAVIVVVRTGKKCDEGETDAAMIAAAREGAKKAAALRGKIAVPKMPETFVLEVPMANEAAAQLATKMLAYPVKVNGKRVSRESKDFMEIYGFLQDTFKVCDEARKIERAKPKP